MNGNIGIRLKYMGDYFNAVSGSGMYIYTHTGHDRKIEQERGTYILNVYDRISGKKPPLKIGYDPCEYPDSFQSDKKLKELAAQILVLKGAEVYPEDVKKIFENSLCNQS